MKHFAVACAYAHPLPGDEVSVEVGFFETETALEAIEEFMIGTIGESLSVEERRQIWGLKPGEPNITLEDALDYLSDTTPMSVKEIPNDGEWCNTKLAGTPRSKHRPTQWEHLLHNPK